MHLDRFPKLSKEILKAYSNVHSAYVMPSMRGMQFAGDAVLKNNVRLYNCSFANIDDVRVFGEAVFILLSGAGFGFSVQKRHVSRLPKVVGPREEGTFIVQDSILGWAQAVDVLMESYLFGRVRPAFDFSHIRPKGSYLVTTGAKAPGPEPLKKALELVEGRLKSAIGRKLSSIEVYDIVCILSDAVYAGGIRRAALIALFDKFDEEMLKAKQGDWWVKTPWRARSNNSAMLLRSETTREEYEHVFNACKNSGSGEPGFIWTNNLDMGTNPCAEIGLNNMQFCNLTTINQTGVETEKHLMDRVHAATFLGTLQATYTDFPYLRPGWKEMTEKEALLGVSFTGVADNVKFITSDLLVKAAKYSLEVNQKYATKLGINPAARVTTLKPEGTSSCVLGSSSGIHTRFADYYIRRIRMNKDDALAVYLKNVIPDLVEDDKMGSGVVVSVPQESPQGSLIRSNETALTAFDRALQYNCTWVTHGHVSGDNKHNVSVTISVKDEEWDELREAMWFDRDNYNGVSLLPYDGGTYVQAPFEECSKETFKQMEELVKNVDLKHVREEEDNTNRIEQLACVGGVCEINI